MMIPIYVTNKFLKSYKSLKKDRGSKPGSTPYIIKELITQLGLGEGTITNEYQNHRSITNRDVWDIHPGGKGDRNNTVMTYRYNKGNLELLDIILKHDDLDRRIKNGDKYSVVDKEFDMSMLEELKLYNANSRGKSTGDCVKRALSMALDVPYDVIGKDLNNVKNSRYSDSWKTETVYEPVIKKYVFNYQKIKVTSGITTEQFAEQHPSGSYILEVSSKHTVVGDHLVCVLNGDIWDSWDSTQCRVCCYYPCDVVDKDTGEITNISRDFKSFDDNLDNYYNYMDSMIKNTFDKSKGSLNCELLFHDKSPDNPWGDYYFKQYHLVSPCLIVNVNGDKVGRWQLVDVALTPTTDPNSVYDLIDKSVKLTVNRLLKPVKDKIKMDNAKSIADDISAKLWDKAGYVGEPHKDYYYFDNHYEKSMYNWIVTKFPQLKYFVRSINIQSPGEYSDSVNVSIYALPDDPRFDASTVDLQTIYLNRGNNNIVSFQFYDIPSVKDMIKRYVSNWDRPYDDYYPDEVY